MNSIVRTAVVFLALVAVVVVASFVYRNTKQTVAPAPAADSQAPQPVDEASLHPELRDHKLSSRGEGIHSTRSHQGGV